MRRKRWVAVMRYTSNREHHIKIKITLLLLSGVMFIHPRRRSRVRTTSKVCRVHDGLFCSKQVTHEWKHGWISCYVWISGTG